MDKREQKRLLKRQLTENEQLIQTVKELVLKNHLSTDEPGFNSFFQKLLVRSFELECEIAKL